MKIRKIKIKNYRSIANLDVLLFPYMVFVGKNNSGKSNIMKALHSFFTYDIEKEDFRKINGKRKPKIEIGVKFVDFTPGEKKLYEGKIINQGDRNAYLLIRLVAELRESGKINVDYEYYTELLDQDSDEVQADFEWLFDKSIQRSETKLRERDDVPEKFIGILEEKKETEGWKRLSNNRFQELRSIYISKYIELDDYPKLTRWQDISINSRNTTDYLGNFFFIPAVQDIEKETRYSGRGKTNINNLMNYILDQMHDPERMEKRKKKVRSLLADVYHLEDDKSKMNEIREELNHILSNFDNSKIFFETQTPNIGKMVRDSLKVYIHDGVKTEVQYKGHGLQRYFLVALFKLWSKVIKEKRLNDKDAEETELEKLPVCSSAYFAIEEPELFLHPQYQRMMKDYLQEIAFTEENQIILNTHSPNFIEFNGVEEVVKVIKEELEEGTQIIQPIREKKDGRFIIPQFTETWGGKEQQERFNKINSINMHYYLNPARNELFFADKVVLVEGQTEKMMLDAWARYYFRDDIEILNKISYIDCIGKHNMQQFIKMLGMFKIPFVLIFDSDLRDDKNNKQIRKTKSFNYHMQENTKKAGGKSFTLDHDFESEFDILSADYHEGRKVHKPYLAFKKYFKPLTGEPKEEMLEKLKEHSKLQKIFKEIYEKNLN